MARLTGKTALITGGTTGIGFATAKLFISEGARVAITGQNAERVAAAGKELGEGVIALRADVASLADMRAVAQRLKADFGTLDILFANAGIASPMPFSDVDEANIDRLLDINVKGVIYSVQSMLPLLANPASVVLNSSTLAEKGAPGMAVYAATKAAVRSLARSLSTEYTARGIRFNVVSPGLTETPIYGKLGMSAEAVEQWGAQMVAGVPAKRFAQADEIARAVLFLASEDSSYMLGENLLVDGGFATI
jgi:NAD(P)-dependent dehydrogenase (short-subunit alcohol dehydrogenase family)